MACKTCVYYKKPLRLDDRIVIGKKGKCCFVKIQGYYRKVKPDESCCMDTSGDKNGK